MEMKAGLASALVLVLGMGAVYAQQSETPMQAPPSPEQGANGQPSQGMMGQPNQGMMGAPGQGMMGAPGQGMMGQPDPGMMGDPFMGPGMMGDEEVMPYGYGMGMPPGPMYDQGYGYGPGPGPGSGQQPGYGYGYGPGPGYGYGPGHGMPRGMGPGTMGPGMMGPGMMGDYTGPYYGRGPRGHMMGPGTSFGPLAGTVRGLGMLNLSEEQRRTIDNLLEQHRQASASVWNDIREESSKLRQLYGQEQWDATAISSTYEDIFNQRRKLIESAVNTRNQIFEALTEEQRQQLRQGGFA